MADSPMNGGPSMGGPATSSPSMAGSATSSPAMGTMAMAMGSPSMTGSAPRNGALGITSIAETLAVPTSPTVKPIARTYDRYRVRVDEYVTFHQKGFLIVRG